MRHVLIVDDEEYSRNGIASIFQNHSPAWNTSALFSDGMEALNHLRNTRNKPDLIVTDIRMPKFSGLELIAKIRETDTTIPIIIVSGYSEFSYAKQAVDFGVFRYILKPFLTTEFEAAISSVEHFLHLKEYNTPDNISSEEMYHFTDLLFSETIELNRNESRILLEKSISFSMNDTWFMVLDGNFQYRQNLPQIRDRLHRFFSVLKKNYRIFLFHQSLYCILIPFSDISKDALLYLSAQLSYSLGLNYEIRFGICPLSDKSVASAFFHAMDALTQNYYEKQPQAFFYHSTEPAPPPYSIFQNLENTLNSNSLLDSRDSIFEFMDYVTINKPSYLVLQEWINTLCSVITTFAFNQSLTSYWENEIFSNLKRLYKYENLQSLEDDLLNLIDSLFQLQKDYMESGNQYLINQIKSYLAEHFAENISLTQLSDIFQVNYHTLSNSFKAVTNQTIMDYLTELKMNEAKYLLLTTNDKVYEIAEKIGYNEPKYFIKRFRNLIGVTPKEYRRIYGK